MRRFGYYITESSEHTSEYTPYFIKNAYPELIERFKAINAEGAIKPGMKMLIPILQRLEDKVF